MEITIKRINTSEEGLKSLSKLTSEDISKAVIQGLDAITKSRISRIERAIPESYEEAKMDKTLKPSISQLDYSSLKQIDALMRRHRGNGGTQPSISPENLSIGAINLYVAIVKRVCIGTVDKCSGEYTIEELSTITNGLLTLNQKMTTFGPNDKDKKFYATEEMMNTLTNINNAVSRRISSEVSSTKKMILAK